MKQVTRKQQTMFFFYYVKHNVPWLYSHPQKGCSPNQKTDLNRRKTNFPAHRLLYFIFRKESCLRPRFGSAITIATKAFRTQGHLIDQNQFFTARCYLFIPPENIRKPGSIDKQHRAVMGQARQIQITKIASY